MRNLFIGILAAAFIVASVRAQPSPAPSPSPSPTSKTLFPVMLPQEMSPEDKARLEELVKKYAGQTSPSVSPAATISPQQFGGRSSYETQLGWGILIFGLLVTGLQVLVMLKLKKGWGTESIRIVGLTLVLTSGLFLIVTGYSQEQIAPMIGLLGTITGFLLGKTSSPKEAE